MTPNEYQTQAARTLIDDSAVVPLTAHQHRIVWNIFGFAGEVGEVLRHTSHHAAHDLAATALWVCEMGKKQVFHDQGLDMFALRGALCQSMVLLGMCARHAVPKAAPTIRPALQKELGDCCGYAAALCSVLGLELDDVTDPVYATDLAPIMAANIAKLAVRFPAGWSTVDAAAKADEVPV